MSSKKKLGEILIDSGLIKEYDLTAALRMQKETGEKLGEILVSKGFVTNDQIIDAVKKQLNIPFIDLDKIAIEQEIINILTGKIARKYEVLPVDIVNGKLLLAMSDPTNYFAIEDIRISTGYPIKAGISSKKSIINNIEKYYEKEKAQEAVEIYNSTYSFDNKSVSVQEEDDDDLDAPIIRFINSIIENAIQYNASDIHIEPGKNELRIRYRVDGVLSEILKTNINIHESVVSRIKIMADLNIAERRIPQDGRIDYKSVNKSMDIRVSIAPTIFGEKTVMRLLDKSNFLLDINKLGFEDNSIELVTDIINKPYGIILLCGPTGSGKTTTLYSFINEINNIEKNIITIENPVEYNLKGVNQMQVNEKIGFIFSSGLRSILRQDPDIILVGEIRDNETAEIATRAALTGHLVFSTIHTNNAVSTITRLKDMGIESYLLSSTLTGIISQRLVRKICPNCIEEYNADDNEKNILGVSEDIKLKRGKGCTLCNMKGYKGREAVFEILYIDNKIREMIDKNISETQIEEYARTIGMKDIYSSCKEKVLKGITTVDEILRIIIWGVINEVILL